MRPRSSGSLANRRGLAAAGDLAATGDAGAGPVLPARPWRGSGRSSCRGSWRGFRRYLAASLGDVLATVLGEASGPIFAAVLGEASGAIFAAVLGEASGDLCCCLWRGSCRRPCRRDPRRARASGTICAAAASNATRHWAPASTSDAFLDLELHVRRHVVRQPAVGIVGVDHHRVGDHVLRHRGVQPHLAHRAVKFLAGIGVDGEGHGLADVDPPDVGLVDRGPGLYALGVAADEKQAGDAHVGDHGLADVDLAVDDHAVDRRADGAVVEIGFCQDHGGLGTARWLPFPPRRWPRRPCNWPRPGRNRWPRWRWLGSRVFGPLQFLLALVAVGLQLAEIGLGVVQAWPPPGRTGPCRRGRRSTPTRRLYGPWSRNRPSSSSWDPWRRGPCRNCRSCPSPGRRRRRLHRLQRAGGVDGRKQVAA